MTTEQRLDRIEHLTAGIAEERRKDRDEYKALWRDTQERINRADERMSRMADAVAKVALDVDRLAIETRLRIAELAEESRAADEKLGSRIEALVSAIGQFIARQ
jgi:hypothetical protein